VPLPLAGGGLVPQRPVHIVSEELSLVKLVAFLQQHADLNGDRRILQMCARR
jgi:hypothetical protein